MIAGLDIHEVKGGTLYKTWSGDDGCALVFVPKEKKVIDYLLASVDDVPSWIKKGWKPYGSPLMPAVQDVRNNYVYQAMVKEA